MKGEPAWCDTRSWFESSKAAELLKMKEADLIKGIRDGMYPHLHHERGDKVDAVAPYKSFKFVFVAPEGTSAAGEMSITLREWTHLCHSLSSDKALSIESKALFLRYTGRSADDNAVVDEQKATPRFILPEVLKQKLRDNPKTSKQSSKSKQSKNNTQAMSTNSGNGNTATRGGNTAPGFSKRRRGGTVGYGAASHLTCSGDSFGSAPTAASLDNVDEQNAKRTCIGLKNARVDNYVANNPESGVLYCRKYWDQFRGAWRDKDCPLQDKADAGDDTGTWTNYPEGWQCHKCNAAKRNIRQSRHPVLFPEKTVTETTASTAGVDTATAGSGSNISNSNDLKKRVVALYRQHGAVAFVSNGEVKETMIVLRCRNIFGIDCGDGTKVFLCPGFEGEGCDTLGVVKMQKNNTDLCSSCQTKSKQSARTERSRIENKTFRLDPTSTMQQCNRTEEERSLVAKKANINRKVAKKRLQRMEAKFKATEIKFEGESEEFTAFRTEMEEKLRDICDKQDDFRTSARAALIEVMEDGLKEEKDDPDAKIEEKDIDGILTFVVEELQNTLKDLAGKENQKEYSALTLQLAYSDWSRSQASYRANSALTPQSRPSMRTLQRHRAATKVRDGICTKAYEIRYFARTAAAEVADKAADELAAPEASAATEATAAATHPPTATASKVPKERGVLYVDEMKLKEEMVYSTITHEPVGMANDTIDIKKIMKRIVSGEKDEMKPAVYVNQWRYKNLVSCEAFNVEFWYNDGKLSPETLFRQFLQVLFSLELIGCQVRGLCLDAGGSNARFTRLLRQLKSLGDVSWINDELLCFVNPVDKSRKIHYWFCVTHQTKSNRNQIYASDPEGAKAFEDANDVPFGWDYLRRLLKADETSSVCNQTRLCDRVIRPNKYSKMNVSDAKIPFEDKTLAFAATLICDELKLSAQELKDKALAAAFGNPPRFLVSAESHHPTYVHGYFFHVAQCLEEEALSRLPTPLPPPHSSGASASAPFAAPSDAPASSAAMADASALVPPEHPQVLSKEATNALCQGIDFNDDHMYETPPIPTPQLLKDIAAFKYLAVNNALLNNLFLNTKERLNKHNISQYEALAKKLMQYFGDWKEAQLRRKQCEYDHWVKSFLANETYENLRVAVCGFTAFAKAALECVEMAADPTFQYISMVMANSTTIEGTFSGKRASGLDKGTNYHLGNTNDCVKMNEAAMMRSSYCAGDMVGEKDAIVPGSSFFQSASKKRDKRMKEWRSKHPKPSAPVQRFGSGPDFPGPKSENGARLFGMMNRPLVDNGYLMTILSWDNFISWRRLGIGSDTDGWFDAIVRIGELEFQATCHKMMHRLFQMLEAVMQKSNGDALFFEFEVYKFYISDEFVTFYCEELPVCIRNDRMGAILLVRTLAELVEQWFIDAMIEIATTNRPPQQDGTESLSDDDMNNMIHRFVGAGLRKCSRQFKANTITGDRKFRVAYSRDTSSEAEAILAVMTLEDHHQAASDMDYVENYYPNVYSAAQPRWTSIASVRVLPLGYEINKNNTLCYNRQ